MKFSKVQESNSHLQVENNHIEKVQKYKYIWGPYNSEEIKIRIEITHRAFYKI